MSHTRKKKIFRHSKFIQFEPLLIGCNNDDVRVRSPLLCLAQALRAAFKIFCFCQLSILILALCQNCWWAVSRINIHRLSGREYWLKAKEASVRNRFCLKRSTSSNDLYPCKNKGSKISKIVLNDDYNLLMQSLQMNMGRSSCG
jgi:hypothetical protein